MDVVRVTPPSYSVLAADHKYDVNMTYKSTGESHVGDWQLEQVDFRGSMTWMRGVSMSKGDYNGSQQSE